MTNWFVKIVAVDRAKNAILQRDSKIGRLDLAHLRSIAVPLRFRTVVHTVPGVDPIVCGTLSTERKIVFQINQIN